MQDAQADPLWADNDILNYELSQQEPWTFTVLYRDGGVLVIPLTKMRFDAVTGPKLTFFRRHQASGRIVPFQLAQADLPRRSPTPAGTSGADTMLQVVPPRFDPALTPLITSYLNQAQMLFMMEGFTDVFALQLANPVLLGWGSGAALSSSTRQTLLRAGLRRGAVSVAVDAAAVGESLFAQTSRLGGTGFQRFLEFARRLSGTRGLSTSAKAGLLEGYAIRFGIEVGGQMAKEGGRILLIAKDGKTALQIVADGTITFGRFDLAAMDIVNPTVIRALAP